MQPSSHSAAHKGNLGQLLLKVIPSWQGSNITLDSLLFSSCTQKDSSLNDVKLVSFKLRQFLLIFLILEKKCE